MYTYRPMSKVISRDESWHLQYRIRPYLAGATSEEMESRLDDILRNLYCFTLEGKVGAVHPNDGGLVWSQKLTDFALECSRRRSKVEDFIHGWDLPFKSEALAIIKNNQHLRPHLDARPVFCKYGYEKFMRPMLEEGSI
jgi:hypothetical protein